MKTIRNQLFYLAFLFVLVFYFSCTSPTQNTVDYSLIDFSYFDGNTDYYSIKLYNTGKMYVYTKQFKGEPKYYQCNVIDQKLLYTIQNAAKNLLQMPPDTVYGSMCADCDYYRLIIKSPDKQIHTFVADTDLTDDHIGWMKQIVYPLCEVVRDNEKSVDSIFRFESRTAEFFEPIPLPLK